MQDAADTARTLRLRAAARRLSFSAAVLAGVSSVASLGASILAARRLTSPARPPRPNLARLERPLLPRSVRISGADAARPGRWGLRTGGGYVQVGDPVVHHPDGTVSRRRVFAVGTVEPSEAAFERVAFPSDPQLCAQVFPGLAVLQVKAPEGTFPLWYRPPADLALLREGSPAAGRCAVVGVHGRGVSPAELLRVASAAAEAQMAWFSVSYRNDVGVQVGGTGRAYLGYRESDDLWAALRQVRSLGFDRVVLVGISLGGAVVSNLLFRHGRFDGPRLFLRLPDLTDVDEGRWLAADMSEPPLQVVGLMFEAPALDWPEIVATVARGMRLPGFLAAPTLLLARMRTRLDPEALVPLARLDTFLAQAPPMLVVHGVDDEVVPVSVSDRLVAASPGAAYLRLPDVGHAQGYNLAHQRYFASVRALLATAARYAAES